MRVQDFFDGNGGISSVGWDVLGKTITYPSSLMWGFSFPPKRDLRSKYHLRGEDHEVEKSRTEDAFIVAVARDEVESTEQTAAALAEARTKVIATYDEGHKKEAKNKGRAQEAADGLERDVRSFVEANVQFTRVPISAACTVRTR